MKLLIGLTVGLGLVAGCDKGTSSKASAPSNVSAPAEAAKPVEAPPAPVAAVKVEPAPAAAAASGVLAKLGALDDDNGVTYGANGIADWTPAKRSGETFKTAKGAEVSAGLVITRAWLSPDKSHA